MLKGHGLTVLARFLTSIQAEMPSCCAPTFAATLKQHGDQYRKAL
jgi:hypothetical protein